MGTHLMQGHDHRADDVARRAEFLMCQRLHVEIAMAFSCASTYPASGRDCAQPACAMRCPTTPMCILLFTASHHQQICQG